MKKRRFVKYTDDDIRFMQRWHGRKTLEQIAKHVKHSVHGVACKMRDLGLIKPRKDYWTEEEIATLRRFYGLEKMDSLAQRVGRSYKSTAMKIYELGLKRNTGLRLFEDDHGTMRILNRGRKIFWTGQMLADLKEFFPVTENPEMADMLGVSESTMHRKARELGLKKDPDYIKQHNKVHLMMAQAHNRKYGNNGMFKPGQRGPGLGFMKKYIDQKI